MSDARIHAKSSAKTEPKPAAPGATETEQDPALASVIGQAGKELGGDPPTDPSERHRKVLHRLPSTRLRRRYVLTLGRKYGNSAVQRALASMAEPDTRKRQTADTAIRQRAVGTVMRDPVPAAAPAATPVARTSRSSISEAAYNIYEGLSLAQTTQRRENTLREILLHHDQAGELKSEYQSRFSRDLMTHVQEVMGREDALRADEYLNWGRLRPVAKLLLAIDGAGTNDETVWRVLPEVYNEGDAVGKWAQLVSRPLAICQRWSGMSLDAALADDFSGGDLDKARALVRYGKLRPVDKIRVGTNQAGTDEALVLEGLREANQSTIRAEYREAYNEDLEDLLFDKYDQYGNLISHGELSGEDAAHARLLLNIPASDPDRLVRMVQVATEGVGTNTTLIWDAISDAVRRRDSGDGPESEAARVQLSNLAAQVADPNDPLGLRGFWGELNEADHARLRAMLGIAETSTDVPGGYGLTTDILNDPLVQRLRGMGGVDNRTVFETLMTADAPTTRAFAAGWNDRSSAFRAYVTANTTVTSGEYQGLETIFNGTLYERLRFCAGGLRDDYEDYAYNLLRNHSTEEQRRELRQALRQLDRGETPSGEAGRAISALYDAFSTSEMGQVRTILQSDSIDVLDRAAELEENVERERSWWYGVPDDLRDELRQMRAEITLAGLDAQMTSGEEAGIRATQGQVAAALEDYVRLRDEYTNYASQAISIAAGLLVTAATGGAAGPAVIAALVRAAVASALARVVTEKTLRGDRFDLAGGDGVRAFINGAVDGAMNVAGAAIAARAMGAVAGPAVREAIEQGTATLGVRLAGSAIEGGVGGTVGGTVDAVTNEDTWRTGVSQGLANVFNAAIAAGGQGALMSAGMTGVQAIGGRLAGDGSPHGQPDGTAHPAAGTPDGHATGDATATTSAGVHIQPGQLFDAHPMVGMARGGDDVAIRQVLQDLGPWEVAIAHLSRGTGPAAAMSEAVRNELRDALVAHRQRLVSFLDEQFGARPVEGASTEAGSDVDLNVMGENAGQKLIDARNYLDRHYPGWQQTYRMALLIDARRVGTVTEHLADLPPAQRAQIEARITRTGELFALARRIRNTEPEGRAALLERVSGEDRARVEQLVAMDERAIRIAHDRALQEGDAAMRRLRGETDPVERARLAAEVTERQMLANMLNDDAYITPGAVGQFAGGRAARTAPERYQAAIDQIDMIGHQVHAHEGVLGAMRSYEIFKYIQRFCDLVEDSGLAVGDDASKLTWFRNWAEYVYRVERDATASASATEGPRTLASSASRARVRLTDPESPRPGVSDRFLLDNYRDFQEFADRMSGRLRQAALGEHAPAVGGASSGGDPAPLVTVPRLTAADEAARTAPEAATASGQTGVTSVSGTATRGTTPLLGQANQPIGRPVANEDAARALVARLTAGDATALHEIGVTPPPNYDPRGREWGIGQTADGRIVIIEGMVDAVNWREFTANGGIPLAHSHPMLPGREMVNPGRTMQELLPGTGRGDSDAVHVLPSVADFLFCAEHGLQMHEVHTPYAHLGNGRIGNPAPGLPLISFRIVGIQQVGELGGLPVYRALLGVADSEGGTFDVEPVWILGTRVINEIGTSEPSGMNPVQPRTPTGTGAASGAGQASDNQDQQP